MQNMNWSYHIPQFFLDVFIRNMYILDFKQGDVNGDGIADIKVDIDSGGSGGYLYSYIYSFDRLLGP